MTLPQTMQAIAITQAGGPEVLALETHPLPNIADDEVLIAVKYAGVNRPDVLQRLGAYPPPKDASPLPGLEVSGTIAAIGANVTRWQIGDEAIALTPGGGYAEYVRCDEGAVLPKPQSLNWAEAAALPETIFTVWHNVFQRGALKQGELLLIHGGSSGIGTTAIQLAKAFGARVAVTVGSATKASACLALGADLAINYKAQDFVEALKAFEPKGADVILDMVGGAYIPRNHQTAAMDGRIVQIALLGGAKAEVDFSKVMMKRLVHTGSTLRPRSNAFKKALAGEIETIIYPWIESGAFAPVMHHIFPLAEATKAHAMMEESQHIGKIVLKVQA